MPAWVKHLLEILLGKPDASPAPSPGTPPVPGPPTPQPYRDWYVISLNRERSLHRLPPMRLDRALNSVAMEWAAAEAAGHSISHVGMATRIGRAYPNKACAENVATGHAEVEKTFEQWLRSPGHYANMVGDYNITGLGMATAADGTPYWCSNFCKA